MCTELVDSRLLSEIPFHGDAVWMRMKLDQAGVKIAQDIIDLGCTGMTLKLRQAFGVFLRENTAIEDSAGADAVQHRLILDDVKRVRSTMGGAGFGLPCYVPSNLFCLVHNTIGGLQQGQAQRHPEGLKLCTRQLTDAEALQVRAMETFVAQEGLKDGEDRFGLEAVERNTDLLVGAEHAPVFHATDTSAIGFTCPEHKEIVFACRYCLAAAVIHGPFQPVVEIAIQQDGASTITRVPLNKLDEALANGDVEIVEAFVRVKRWSRKLIVEE